MEWQNAAGWGSLLFTLHYEEKIGKVNRYSEKQA